MLSSMTGPLTFALVLAVLLMAAAMLAEGRGRHLAMLVQRLRSRRELDGVVDEVLADVPRPEGDWELLTSVNSIPDRPAPGDRAVAWVSVAGDRASRAVAERASVLSHPEQVGDDSPRSGELGLARQ